MLVAMECGVQYRAGMFSGSPQRPRIMMRICAAVSFLFWAGCLNAQPGACDHLPATTPKDINALASTGLALSHAEQYNAAAVCYRKILAIDPNIPQTGVGPQPLVALFRVTERYRNAAVGACSNGFGKWRSA